jgi:molybdopterin synthase catalytic subunit
MFDLTDKPIDGDKLKALLRDDRAGALITFEGVVRNHNEGKSVEALSYEAYEPLARAEAERIFAEVAERFDIIKVVLVHRVGLLHISEAAVFVGVAAAHRDHAYLASRYIIDETKNRLPIWKKEHYTDASSAWVNCRHTHSEVASESVQCVS